MGVVCGYLIVLVFIYGTDDDNKLGSWRKKTLTRKSITYNYMLYKGVVVSKINNHYSIIYLGLTT